MRRVITETTYTFTPSTKTITVPRYIPKERLLLITDVTNNIVLYNFSDTNLTATLSYNPSTNITTIVPSYNTTGANFASTDKLQILVDEYLDYSTPAETQLDPVGKQRVSEPQALIDTDFEYGTQQTKWETIFLTNNRPSYFINPQLPLNVVDVQATQGSTAINLQVAFTTGTGTATSFSNTTIFGSSTTFTNQLAVGYTIYTSGFAFVGTIAAIISDTILVMTATPVNSLSNAAFSFQNQVLPVPGVPLTVTDTTFAAANGQFMITSVSGAGANVLTINSRYAYQNTSGSIFNASQTLAFPGSFYTNSNLAANTCTFSGNTATYTTLSPHGLQVGSGVLVSNANVAGYNGAWTVCTLNSDTSFTVQLDAVVAGGSNVGNVCARPDGFTTHRAFDGGVFFSIGNPLVHNSTVIRQTRRFFRYQSGKGIQVSTGTVIKTNVPVDQVSANDTQPGAVITIKTKVYHSLTTGTQVYLGNSAISTGVNGITTGYEGAYTVVQTPDANTLTVTAGNVLASTTCTGIPSLSVTGWYGAKCRVGLFEQQNGMFWEFDGQTLYAVRRNCVQQIAGYSSVVQGSATVTGISVNGVTTKFSSQVVPGDYLVIRGQTYRVIQVASDTSMTISPAYRGATLGQVQISKVQDEKVPQNAWNLDRCDGTGPSGYSIDLTRIQMWYIDFTWYGAGAARFGFKQQDGQIIYAHRFIHNNKQFSSFLRSGNLPAHYEVNSEAPETQLTATFASGAATLNVGNTAAFPNNGILLIRSITPEYVTYNSKTAASFNITQRGQAGSSIASCTLTAGNCNVLTSSSITAVQPGMFVYGQNILNTTYVIDTGVTGSGTNVIRLSQAPLGSSTSTLSTYALGNTNQTHTYSATAPIGIQMHAPYFSPTISHWGTSVIMDGKFDNDKSYVFIAGMVAPITVPQGARQPLMSIRLGPSVDNGRPGVLGSKELINHMQLVMAQMDLTATGIFLITLVLNGFPSGGTFANVGGSSLSQVCYHNSTHTLTGGEPIFAFFAQSNGTGIATVTQQDLSYVRDLGNSILGGGQTNSAGQQVYPDGPDVITVVAQNIDTANRNIQARLSWTEAQA
jgi:hypothetical protein